MVKRTVALVFMLLSCCISGFANTGGLDQSGKINTVIACVAVIIVGIVLFLFFLERRIKAMEKELED